MNPAVAAAALVVALEIAAGCSVEPAATPLAMAGERDGLTIAALLTARSGSLHVGVVVRNGRTESAYLDADQCGRITEVVLARTQFEPEGATWTGSAQAVKELILDDQLSSQHPDGFHPRRPTDASSEIPECVRPDRPVQLGPGQEVAERWELPAGSAYTLDAVGSAATVVRVEVVEARAPDELEFLNILPPGSADEERAGRNLRVDQPAASVIERPAPVDDGAPSRGELYDVLLDKTELRSWIEAQPAESWRLAILTPASVFVQAPATEQVKLRLVTTEFERAAHATARADGTDVAVDLPTESDRTREFERRAGTLPPGIALIEEPDSYSLGEDVFPGSLRLPSGRVWVGEYIDEEPLDLALPTGSYPVHATLARYQDREWQDVALATMVLSDEPTVRWADMGTFAVDGGSATFTSVEGLALLNAALEDGGEGESTDLSDLIFDSRVAHEYQVTEFSLGEGVNLVEFSSGNGDGGYPVFVGYDAAGAPTRVVVDFYLLHLAWPE